MAYTESQAEALREALASGVLTVEYDGKRVTYRSVREIKEALAQVEPALRLSSPACHAAARGPGGEPQAHLPALHRPGSASKNSEAT